MNDFFERLKKEQKIIVYGAGKLAHNFIKHIRYFISNVEIDCALVSNTEGNPYHILDVPVINANSLSEHKHELPIYVATSKVHQDGIANFLAKKGYKNFILVHEHVLDEMGRISNIWKLPQNQFHYVNYMGYYMEMVGNRLIFNGKKKTEVGNCLYKYRREMKSSNVYMGRLVVVVGTKCSLRCKECNNLIPYFKPQKDFDINDIKLALDRVMQTVEAIEVCELIGGDPFLSSNLYDLLYFIVAKSNIKHIEITTNGTILPSANIVELMKNVKVEVRISDYGEYSKKDKLLELLSKNNINYEVLEMENWISPGGVNKRGRTISVLRKYFNSCGSAYLCMTLFQNRLYHCARAASLHSLGYMQENEFLKVDGRLSKNDILNFIKADYSIACDYCDMVSENCKIIKPAEQI